MLPVKVTCPELSVAVGSVQLTATVDWPVGRVPDSPVGQLLITGLVMSVRVIDSKHRDQEITCGRCTNKTIHQLQENTCKSSFKCVLELVYTV